MKKIVAGICQFDIQLGAVDANIKRAFKGIHQLNDQGASLLVLPEMWSCGFDYPGLATHAAKTPKILDDLARIASDNELIIAGSLPEANGSGIYNTLFVIDSQGKITGKYRKTHLFPLINEDRHFCAGNRPVVCQTDAGRLGLMICYDLRFPEFCRSLALGGAEIVIVCAQWPASRIHHWDILLQARAIENQLFVIAANRTGLDEDLIFNGHSQVVSPTGEVLAMAGNHESTATALTDLEEIDRFRNQFNCLEQRMPSAYEL